MQDPTTGEMVPVSEAFAKALRDGHDEAARQRGKPASNLSRVLHVGEEVTINGARFKIVTMGRRFVKLEGIALDAPPTPAPSVCRSCGEPCDHCG